MNTSVFVQVWKPLKYFYYVNIKFEESRCVGLFADELQASSLQRETAELPKSHPLRAWPPGRRRPVGIRLVSDTYEAKQRRCVRDVVRLVSVKNPLFRFSWRVVTSYIYTPALYVWGFFFKVNKCTTVLLFFLYMFCNMQIKKHFPVINNSTSSHFKTEYTSFVSSY